MTEKIDRMRDRKKERDRERERERERERAISSFYGIEILRVRFTTSNL